MSILWNCTTVLGTGCVRNLSWGLWVCLSVNLALTSCVELRPDCEIFVADCTCSLGLPLSRIDTFLSTAVTKCRNSYKKTLLTHLSYWLPDIKVAQFSFEEDVNSYLTKFSKKMTLSNYLWCPMMNKKISSIFTFYISRMYDFC